MKNTITLLTIAILSLASVVNIPHHSKALSSSLLASGVTCSQIAGYKGGMSLVQIQKKAKKDGSPIRLDFIPGSDSTYQVQIGYGDAFNGIGREGYKGPIVRIGFTNKGVNANKALLADVYGCGENTGFIWYP
jgi:hypothetical protein